MSTEVATLGLAVDSSQVTTASAALDRLTAAAKPAANAATALQSAVTPASASLLAAATASRSAGTAADAHSESLRGQHLVLNAISNDLALFGGNLGSAAAVAGSLYIENAHLFEGFGGLKSAISALVSPTTLVVGGFLALGAAAVYAYTSIAATERQFGALSDVAMTTVGTLHDLETAAAFKGVDTADFLKNMTGFAMQSAQARDNLGSLATLLRANGQSAGTLEQNFLNVANIIQNIGDESKKYQIITQAGLPATREWVQFLSQGAAGIKAAEAEATKFGGAADEMLILRARQFDDQWNTTWKNFSNGAKQAFLDAVTAFDNFANHTNTSKLGLILNSLGPNAVANLVSYIGGSLVAGQSANSRVSQGFVPTLFSPSVDPALKSAMNQRANNGAGLATTPTVNPDALKQQIALQQQLFGILGQTASVDDQVKQKENEVALARLAGVKITQQQADNLERLAAENALGITQIHTQTDSLTVQAQAYGMNTGAAAAYTAVQTKINEAIRLGNPLTADNIAKLKEQAGALADATQKLDDMNLSQNIGSQFMKDFRNQLQQGASAFDALRTAAANALNSISDKLIDMATKNLVSAAFGGSSGGFSGLLSGLFGSSSSGVGGGFGTLAGVHHGGYGPGDISPSRAVESSIFVGAPRFHTGIGPGEVPAIIRDDESVLTPGQMKQLAPIGAMQQSTPTVVIQNTNTFTNADPASEARLRSYVDQRSKQTVADAVQAVSKVRSNTPSYLRS